MRKYTLKQKKKACLSHKPISNNDLYPSAVEVNIGHYLSIYSV